MKKLLRVIVIMIILLLMVGGGGLWYLNNNHDIVLARIFRFADEHLDTLDLPPDVIADAHILNTMLQKIFVIDDVPRHYLILLQNNMELRPGGGFLGQFATLDIQNARVTSWEIRDANHLDKEIVSDIPAPPSFARWLNITTMKFRDSNWDLDFPTNALRAQRLYNLGKTPQTFDGIIAVNGTILDDILAITGPITVPGYEDVGPFKAGTALIQLEDIVEKPVLLHKMRAACRKREKETGIEEECNTDPETGEKIKKLTTADKVYRKKVLPLLARAMMQKLFGTSEDSWRVRAALAQEHIPQLLGTLVENLRDRDIQLWFADDALQHVVAEQNWGTIADVVWDDDYVAVVDANLGALKTDYYIKRALEYTVDFTGRSAEKNDARAGRMVRYLTPQIKERVMQGTFRTTLPLATMRMTYTHTAQKANYRTSDYHAYTRLYTPRGARWYVREWFFAPTLEKEAFGHTQEFAYKFDIFIGDTLPTMLQYTLPERITEDGYALKIQKQSGSGPLPTTITVITSDGQSHTTTFVLTRDAIVRLEASDGEKKLTVEYL